MKLTFQSRRPPRRYMPPSSSSSSSFHSSTSHSFTHLTPSKARALIVFLTLLPLALFTYRRVHSSSSSLPLSTSDMDPAAAEGAAKAFENGNSSRVSKAASDQPRQQVNQFSIWAMPEEGSPFHAASVSAVSSLSERFGCTPFEPHVTVIGAFGSGEGLDELEVVRRMEQLAATTRPYEVKVKELTSGKLFFQCVYLKMVPTPEVLGLHRKAVEIMGMDADVAAYLPHLSLIYGDLTEEQQEEAKALARASFPSLIPAATNGSLAAESDRPSATPSFHVSSLALYRTDPTDFSMKTWEKLTEFPLTG